MIKIQALISVAYPNSLKNVENVSKPKHISEINTIVDITDMLRESEHIHYMRFHQLSDNEACIDVFKYINREDQYDCEGFRYIGMTPLQAKGIMFDIMHNVVPYKTPIRNVILSQDGLIHLDK